jgi:hypothetical protein
MRCVGSARCEINKIAGRHSNEISPLATIHDASPFTLVDITAPQTPPQPSRVQLPRRDWNPAASASRYKGFRVVCRQRIRDLKQQLAVIIAADNPEKWLHVPQTKAT